MLIYALRTRPGHVLLGIVALELVLLVLTLTDPLGIGLLPHIIAASVVSLAAVAAWMRVEDRVGELGAVNLVAFLLLAVGSPMITAGLA